MTANEIISLIGIILVILIASIGYLLVPKVNNHVNLDRFTGVDMNKRAEYLHNTISKNPDIVTDFNKYNKSVKNGDASEWRKLYILNEAQNLNKESISSSLNKI
jgi:hypothetical protein